MKVDESGPTATTEIVTEVKTPYTSQLKTWKRHNRGGGTENNYSTGTVDEIHGGKRSYDTCADGDKMDVDTTKRHKDHMDYILTASAVTQHRRYQ